MDAEMHRGAEIREIRRERVGCTVYLERILSPLRSLQIFSLSSFSPRISVPSQRNSA